MMSLELDFEERVLQMEIDRSGKAFQVVLLSSCYSQEN